MTVGLPRPRHGDEEITTHELRELAAAVLHDDVQTLARTSKYLRRSYRVVFIGYIVMLVFGVGAIAAAFVRSMTATTIPAAITAAGGARPAGGIFSAFFLARAPAPPGRDAGF